jgi:hypothetical protein
MMSPMEFNRYEFVGNEFECWDCKGKNDVVKCTCRFADEGNREVVRYECSECLRDCFASEQGSPILAWLESDKSKPLIALVRLGGDGNEQPKIAMLQITAPHFVGGVLLDPIADRAIAAAPAVAYMVGWERCRIEAYCAGKRWQVEEC